MDLAGRGFRQFTKNDVARALVVGEPAAHMRLEHDLDYIQRQSLLLDLRILAVTMAREFFSGSGY